MKTALLYTRVSTQSQDRDVQVSTMTKWARDNNYKIIKEYGEVVSGIAEKEERIELNKMIKYLNSNKVDIVLVYELSRLGRNHIRVQEVIKMITDLNVNIYFKDKNIFVLDENGKQTPSSLMLISLLSTFSTIERQTTLQRSREGLRNSALSGRWGGGKYLPFGYKRKDGTKDYEIDDEEAKIVKLIYDKYLEGLGTRRLANYLNKQKIPTKFNRILEKPINLKKKNDIKMPKEFIWRDAVVLRILSNPIYKGERKFINSDTKDLGEIEYFTIESPMIIETEKWNEVERIRKSRNINKKGINKRFSYLLDDVKITCGVCGNSYYPHKRKTGKDNAYKCLTRRFDTKKCWNYGLSIDKVNDGVWYFIRRTDQLKKSVESDMRDSNIRTEINDLSKSIDEKRKGYLIIEKRKKELVNLTKEGIYTVEELKPLAFQQNNKKKELDQDIRVLQTKLQGLIEFDKKQNSLSSFIRNIKNDGDTMKGYIDKIIDRIVIYPVKHEFVIGSSNKWIKGDKCLFFELFLFTSKNPVCYILSQRSSKIQKMEPHWFDKKNFAVIAENPQLLKNIDIIRHRINYDALTGNDRL